MFFVDVVVDVAGVGVVVDVDVVFDVVVFCCCC